MSAAASPAWRFGPPPPVASAAPPEGQSSAGVFLQDDDLDRLDDLDPDDSRLAGHPVPPGDFAGFRPTHAASPSPAPTARAQFQSSTLRQSWDGMDMDRPQAFSYSDHYYGEVDVAYDHDDDGDDHADGDTPYDAHCDGQGRAGDSLWDPYPQRRTAALTEGDLDLLDNDFQSHIDQSLDLHDSSLPFGLSKVSQQPKTPSPPPPVPGSAENWRGNQLWNAPAGNVDPYDNDEGGSLLEFGDSEDLQGLQPPGELEDLSDTGGNEEHGGVFRKESQATLSGGEPTDKNPGSDLKPADAPLHDLLVESMNECQTLRGANETLQGEVERLNKENESSVRKGLERQIELLQAESASLRSSQVQVSTIRAALEKEMELDLLNAKRAVMEEKERQLHRLHEEVVEEKKAMQQVHEKEKRELERVWQTKLEEALERHHQELAKLRSENEVATAAVVAARVTRAAVDKGTQCSRAKDSAPNTTTVRAPDDQIKSAIAQRERQLEEDVACLLGIPFVQPRGLVALVSDYKQDRDTTLRNLELELAGKDEMISMVRDRAAAGRERADDGGGSDGVTRGVVDEPDGDELGALIARYPVQLSAYREALVRSFQALYKERVAGLRAEWESERTRTRAAYDAEVARITECVKNECRRAYGDAVTKAKEDFARVKKAWKESVGAESQKMKNKVAQLQAALDMMKLSATQAEAESKSRMAELADSHRGEMVALREEFRVHFSKLLRQALTKMKERYLATLRSLTVHEDQGGGDGGDKRGNSREGLASTLPPPLPVASRSRPHRPRRVSQQPHAG
ncbi:hypothetical protein HK405_004700, partial [Cladochytrium tenue]